MGRKAKGPEQKKALFSSCLSCFAPKSNIDFDQVPEQILDMMMDRNNLENLNPPSSQRNAVTRRSCTCRNSCLGPLTFHPEVKGQHVKLSAGDRRATRNPLSFHHGVTFSNRPLRIEEKVCMRVERSVLEWHGALRLGFTVVPPGSGPMCSLAIPDLTERQGFWAVLIPENHCSPRTELTFWVSRTGNLCIRTDDGFEHKSGMWQMDTSKPIWAMIDVYGQTSGVLLLGSKKKTLFGTRRSCSAPRIRPTEDNCGYDLIPEMTERMMDSVANSSPRFCQSNTGNEEQCVVCYSKTASVHLDCGHSCLCSQCAVRVMNEFGTCPLCRQCIRS